MVEQLAPAVTKQALARAGKRQTTNTALQSPHRTSQELPIHKYSGNAGSSLEAAWRHNELPSLTYTLPAHFDPTSPRAERIVTQFGVRYGVVEQIAAENSVFIVTEFAGKGKTNRVKIWGPKNQALEAKNNIDFWVLQNFEATHHTTFPKVRSYSQKEIDLQEKQYKEEVSRQAFRQDADRDAAFAFRVRDSRIFLPR